MTPSQAAAAQLDNHIRDYTKNDREAMEHIFRLVKDEVLGRKEAQDAADRWMRASADMGQGGSIRRWATFREFIRLWKRPR